jgi:hypothetical protein
MTTLRDTDTEQFSIFQLFGGSAFAKEYIFKLSDYSQATWGQSELHP